MTKDTWTIIGTVVAIGVALGGIVINQNSQMNTRIDDLQGRMSDGFANVNQRFDDVNQRFNDMNQRMSDGFGNLQRQIDGLQTDVRELRSMQFEALKREPPAN